MENYLLEIRRLLSTGQKYIKPMIDINTITCILKTCISSVLLQSNMNKWRLSQLAKIDELYIKSESTRLLQRSRIDFIEYNH